MTATGPECTHTGRALRVGGIGEGGLHFRDRDNVRNNSSRGITFPLTCACVCTNMTYMKMIVSQPVSPALDELVRALDAKMFKTFSDPTRRQLLKFLMVNRRVDIGSIAAHFPQDRSVISRHLRMMEEAGLLVAEKEARHRFYSINGAAFLREFETMVAKLKACMAECCPDAAGEGNHRRDRAG